MKYTVTILAKSRLFLIVHSFAKLNNQLELSRGGKRQKKKNRIIGSKRSDPSFSWIFGVRTITTTVRVLERPETRIWNLESGFHSGILDLDPVNSTSQKYDTVTFPVSIINFNMIIISSFSYVATRLVNCCSHLLFLQSPFCSQQPILVLPRYWKWLVLLLSM
jgi:hypothetical protein